MGSLFTGSANESRTQTTNTGPWAPQQPYLTGMMGSAQDTYNMQAGQGFWQGQLYAPMNDIQNQGVNAGVNLGNGLLSSGQALSNTGQSATGYLPWAMSNASGIASGNFNQGNNGALNYAAGNVPNSVNMSNAGIQGALSGISGNNLTNLQAQATASATSPLVQNQINAAVSPILDQFNQVTAPNLNAQAAATGNMDSSRAATAQALAQKNAMEVASNTAANIQANAYNQGLNLAESANTANMNAGLGAANAANASTAAGLSGATSANNNTLANNQLMLGGNQQLLGGVGLGSGILSQGASLGQTGVNNLLNSGSLLQQNQQNLDNAAYQTWQGESNYPWQLLGNLKNIIGGSYGQSGTTDSNTTSTESPSVMQGVLSAGALASAPIFGGSSLFSSLGSGLSNLSGGIGSSLGALSGLTGISSGVLSGPTVGTSTLTPYWQGLMSSQV